METKFIEGTNQQYSIREDGFIIEHCYSIKMDIIVSHYDKTTLSCILHTPKKKWVAINTLLYKAFNYRLCTHCKTQIFNKNKYLCETCTIDRKLNPDNKRVAFIVNIKINNMKNSNIRYIDEKDVTEELKESIKLETNIKEKIKWQLKLNKLENL
jgi:hypothetical protein